MKPAAGPALHAVAILVGARLGAWYIENLDVLQVERSNQALLLQTHAINATVTTILEIGVTMAACYAGWCCLVAIAELFGARQFARRAREALKTAEDIAAHH